MSSPLSLYSRTLFRKSTSDQKHGQFVYIIYLNGLYYCRQPCIYATCIFIHTVIHNFLNCATFLSSMLIFNLCALIICIMKKGISKLRSILEST
ncbi:uncharacterized protein EV154DRAFT_22101 [Mucor mucedo]|uniref:uncharacterized protein n=1 Tax=Mucor mucedo TaxID=29922 RepID=UPI00222115D5|nr:uncharacterized protein EV154DRAFT_22101 [Mucor mucedo]KAI7895409.1 hypothetical protein EV154DRAFT_22101 [Mucor mucedo]